MKNNKFCVSKSLVYLVLLLVVLVGLGILINNLNKLQVTNTKASNSIGCNTINSDYTQGSFYKRGNSYFSQTGVDITRLGVSNYCRNLKEDKCRDAKLYIESVKNCSNLYIKNDVFYADSSCQGALVKTDKSTFDVNSIINSAYCKKWGDDYAIRYDCPGTIPDTYVYYKNGQYYLDPNHKTKVTNIGFGNICKIGYNLSGSPTITPPRYGLVKTRCSNLVDFNITGITVTPSVKDKEIYVDLRESDSSKKYYLNQSKTIWLEADKVDDYCNHSSSNLNQYLLSANDDSKPMINCQYFGLKGEKTFKLLGNNKYKYNDEELKYSTPQEICQDKCVAKSGHAICKAICRAVGKTPKDWLFSPPYGVKENKVYSDIDCSGSDYTYFFNEDGCCN